MPDREAANDGGLPPVQELQLARVQWRAEQMRLEDEMEAFQKAKQAFDTAYARTLAQWERTVECTRRWRDAARAAVDAGQAGRGKGAG